MTKQKFLRHLTRAERLQLRRRKLALIWHGEQLKRFRLFRLVNVKKEKL